MAGLDGGHDCRPRHAARHACCVGQLSGSLGPGPGAGALCWGRWWECARHRSRGQAPWQQRTLLSWLPLLFIVQQLATITLACSGSQQHPPQLPANASPRLLPAAGGADQGVCAPLPPGLQPAVGLHCGGGSRPLQLPLGAQQPVGAGLVERWCQGAAHTAGRATVAALPACVSTAASQPSLACRVSFVALFALSLLGRSHPWLCGGVVAWALAVALSRAIMG